MCSIIDVIDSLRISGIQILSFGEGKVQLSDSNLQEIQAAGLHLLNLFVEACQKMELKYFLMGGTLLGAARHRGYIPWDDDIDVGMLRSDFESFKKEGQKYLPSYAFLQSEGAEPDYPHNFMKIRDSRTTLIETSVKHIPMNHGIYIDIFPVDYYPESRIAQKFFELQRKQLSIRIRDAFLLSDNYQPSFLSRMAYLLIKTLFPSISKALNRRGKLYSSVKQSELVANLCGIYGSREIVPYEWFSDVREVIFENGMYYAPYEYDKYLTHVYGDYMKLPPPEKRSRDAQI